ncbi:type III secretion system translocon subunit SctE [Citrobacter portucalensis]|uniref:type III secretion system translocon subunit SctE n=1 Tax=Citrobacter portucalensis TaxID=1639133 RepID=UPI001EC3BFB4|nr:type III secretion system translocon subunit SctE [Citrobacter portucalensis]EDS3841742.1 YopB/SseC family type III secretion system translocon subunit [Salmonella enterica]WNI88036.1 type III secretion system translocon subunit SctE [Citrobacter portucalensis]
MNNSVIKDLNKQIQQHNILLAGAAFESVREDNHFLREAEKALKNVLAIQVTEKINSNNATDDTLTSVVLRSPTPVALEKLNTEGKLTLLLGRLMTLMSDVSVSQLENRLKAWQVMTESKRVKGEQLSKSFLEANLASQTTMDVFAGYLSQLESAKDAYAEVGRKFGHAMAILNSLTTGTAEYEQAKADVVLAGKELATARRHFDMAEIVVNTAYEDVKNKVEQTDKIISQMQVYNLSGNRPEQYEKDNLTSIARFTMLISIFIVLVGKNNEESLKNDMELFRSLQESRQNEMNKKSEEYQADSRKAEDLNRTMGCVGKIVGALLTVVSVVAAIFTGGAGLVLAAAGLALIMTDEVVKATTGTSFIQQALNPIMQHVLKPLMEMIGKAISKTLESMGVDKKKSELVGSIIGAIVAAIAMVAVIIAVAVIGKSAVTKMGHALSKLMDETIKKVLPDVLKQMAHSSSGFFTQGMQRLSGGLKDMGTRMGLRPDRLNSEMVGNNLNKAVLGMMVANTVAQSGTGITHGIFLKKASDAFADFTLARFSMDQISQWLKQAVETFGDSSKIAQDLHKVMSSVIQQNAEASRFILRQTRV